MTAAHRQPRRSLTTRRSGSAYLITLLAMVVLTIVGLSLVSLAQTERQLGANERLTQRVFYAANSGSAISIARVLALNNHDEMTLILNQGAVAAGANFAERVDTSRFHPILTSPCNFCEINSGSQFFDVNHAITANAERIGWVGVGAPPDGAPAFARKTLSEMVALQPWQVSIQSDILPSLTQDQLKKIRF